MKVVKFSSVNEAIRASRLNTGEKMMDKQSNSNPLSYLRHIKGGIR